LGKYNLPRPEAIFEINFFKVDINTVFTYTIVMLLTGYTLQENPKPFCILAKELYPGNFTPTYTHFFIKLLDDKGTS